MAETFKVRVWDNFHYMDDEEAYDSGEYETYDEALRAAKAIVEESVQAHGFDLKLYLIFGDDPVVFPTPVGIERFSGRTYARELCDAHEAASTD